MSLITKPKSRIPGVSANDCPFALDFSDLILETLDYRWAVIIFMYSQMHDQFVQARSISFVGRMFFCHIRARVCTIKRFSHEILLSHEAVSLKCDFSSQAILENSLDENEITRWFNLR